MPYLLFAGAMGYSARELFEASGEDLADVDVGAALSADQGDGPAPAVGGSDPTSDA